MTFRFYDDPTAGNELLVDRYTAGDSAPVVVSDGLFNVTLGTGAVSDGTGPGTFTSLADVFGTHSQVWLRVEVAGEILDPRTKISAAAFALNASKLAGSDASAYLRSDAGDTFSGGELRFADGSTLFAEGNPAVLTVDGLNLELAVNGDLTAEEVKAGRLESDGSIYASGGMYFFHSGGFNESFRWSGIPDRFELSNDLQITSSGPWAEVRMVAPGGAGTLRYDAGDDEFQLSKDLRIGSLAGDHAIIFGSDVPEGRITHNRAVFGFDFSDNVLAEPVRRWPRHLSTSALF